MLRECSRPQDNLRSTWVRDQDGWKTLEAAVSCKAGHNKLQQNLARYYERGVTVFQKPDLTLHKRISPPSSETELLVFVSRSHLASLGSVGPS